MHRFIAPLPNETYEAYRTYGLPPHESLETGDIR